METLVWLIKIQLLLQLMLKVQGSVQCGVTAPISSPLILNGQDTLAGQWPWHAGIFHREGKSVHYKCGGTLISEWFVVTAAHCVTSNGNNLAPEIIFVKLGIHHLKNVPQQQHEVLRIHTVPSFDHLTLMNDIAVLKLLTEAKYDNFVRPACLYRMDDLAGQIGTAIGFGLTEDDVYSDVLKSATVPLVDHQKCLESDRDYFGRLLIRGMVCGGHTNGTSVCNGDSGGGLFVKSGNQWYLGGIISQKKLREGFAEIYCRVDGYAIFTKIVYYLSWINSICDLLPELQVEESQPFQGTRNGKFEWDFTKRVFETQESNVVISPLFVKMMMVLLYEATKSDYPSRTKQELRVVLESNGDLNKTRTLYRQLVNYDQMIHKDFNLELATGIFVDEHIRIPSNKYHIISDHYYSTMVDKVPFYNSKVAEKMINEWVNNITHGRVQKLETKGDLQGTTIAMYSVVHFQGLWTYPFPENGPTFTFYASRKRVKTQFMKRTGQFHFYASKTLGADLLRLPYRGGKFAMYFLLPYRGKTVEEILDKLNTATLHRALRSMTKTEVLVAIPKFKFDFSSRLSHHLKAIGFQAVFSDSASLPLLTRGNGRSIPVSRVFQRTGININELGCDALVTTEIHQTSTSGEYQSVFYANRPFLFFIEDEQLGTLLLAGKVEDPTK